MVVSVEEKVKVNHQVWIRKTNKYESLLTRREKNTRHQNQNRKAILGKVSKKPDYYAGGVRRKGGVSLIWAFMRNCGNQSS